MRLKTQCGFSGADLLMIVAGISILGAIGIPALHRGSEKARYQQCEANLSKVARAVLMYADENQYTLPVLPPTSANGVWWFTRSR